MQEGCSHDGDDEGRDEGEDPFPYLFDGRPVVGAEAVEGADQAAADHYADGEADEGP